MDRTKTTLNELTPTGRASLREIEIQQCKLTVVRNDVHAHEPRLVLNLFTNKKRSSSNIVVAASAKFPCLHGDHKLVRTRD
jgi:hypothetical protein